MVSVDSDDEDASDDSCVDSICDFLTFDDNIVAGEDDDRMLAQLSEDLSDPKILKKVIEEICKNDEPVRKM